MNVFSTPITTCVIIIFLGYLDFPLTDEYYICLTSDDGSKLFIEDSLVISNDGLHGAVQECAFYSSSAGVKHIEVEYFQRGGGAILTLQYVPLSRPPWFRLMRVIDPSEFVPKVRRRHVLKKTCSNVLLYDIS